MIEIFAISIPYEKCDKLMAMPWVCPRRISEALYPNCPDTFGDHAVLDLIWENTIVTFLEAGRSIVVPCGSEGFGRLERVVHRFSSVNFEKNVKLNYDY